jgi:hypothetical protein
MRLRVEVLHWDWLPSWVMKCLGLVAISIEESDTDRILIVIPGPFGQV